MKLKCHRVNEKEVCIPGKMGSCNSSLKVECAAIVQYRAFPGQALVIAMLDWILAAAAQRG